MFERALARRLVVTLVLAMALGELAFSGKPAAPTWPQFHGPRRDNRSDETGLLKKWPSGGPELLWTAKGVGQGYSTVAVAGGLVYTTGNILNHGRTVALVWARPEAYEAVSQFSIPEGGKCPTWAHPVVCGGRLYIRHGDFLYCYDIKEQ